MKQLGELLPPHRFIRIHKSYIVAMDKINTIERQEVHINEHVLPIGNTYLENFNRLLETRKA
jgi:DNA-binding LytR/AlgR family response regulator